MKVIIFFVLGFSTVVFAEVDWEARDKKKREWENRKRDCKAKGNGWAWVNGRCRFSDIYKTGSGSDKTICEAKGNGWAWVNGRCRFSDIYKTGSGSDKTICEAKGNGWAWVNGRCRFSDIYKTDSGSDKTICEAKGGVFRNGVCVHLIDKDKSKYSPYRVVGVQCGPGEHCMKDPSNTLGGGGYFIKSNIPFDDLRQKTLRPNMVSKAVLNNEIQQRDKIIKNTAEQLMKCEAESGGCVEVCDRENTACHYTCPDGRQWSSIKDKEVGGSGSIQ